LLRKVNTKSRILDKKSILREFLEKAGWVFLGQTGGDLVMHVPGLLPVLGPDRQVRIGERFGDIQQGGGKDGGLKVILPLAYGGNDETLAGITIFYLAEQPLHETFETLLSSAIGFLILH
jgi:hypothetical protein